MCKICSELTIKIPEQRQWLRFGVFIVNFEQISRIALVFQLFTLDKQMPAEKMYLVCIVYSTKEERKKSYQFYQLINFWGWKIYNY